MNPKVDLYLKDGCGRCSLFQTPECKVHTWQEELKLLRMIALDSGLTEDVKWGSPCYTLDNKNVLMVSAFKDYAFISFFKGTLLKDEKKLLHSPGENSQAVRQFRFTDTQTIHEQEPDIKLYIKEAIELEKSGAKVAFKKELEEMPEELQHKLDSDATLKMAYEALTPGRQRSYILHVSSAKNSQTRENRVEKCIPKILAGKGFNER